MTPPLPPCGSLPTGPTLPVLVARRPARPWVESLSRVNAEGLSSKCVIRVNIFIDINRACSDLSEDIHQLIIDKTSITANPH